MTPATILIAFLAVMAPCAIFFGGRALIYRWSLWREARTKRAQDMEFAAHEERLERMNQYANKAARHGKAAQRQWSSLHDVPRLSIVGAGLPREQLRPKPEPDDETLLMFSRIHQAQWPVADALADYNETPAPSASLTGNGGTFDGGGASADWSSSPSSDSGCSSSDSGSSDSGSCGSGD